MSKRKPVGSPIHRQKIFRKLHLGLRMAPDGPTSGQAVPPVELFIKDTGDGAQDNLLLENGDNLLLE